MIGKRLGKSVILALCAGALLVAGCETTPLEPSPDFIPDTVIVNDYAQFFRLGPQQAGGADLSLRTGERVMLQRKEFGYSRVQLEDGQVGYMANGDLQAAPPEPRRRRGLRDAATAGGEKPKRGSRGTPSSEEEFYDEIALPDPSLDIMPEEVPLEPLPQLEPSPVDTPERAPVKVPVPGSAPEPAPAPASTPPQEAPAPPVSTST